MNNVVWACRYRGGQESSSSSDSEDDPGYATFQTWNKSDIKMADMQHVDDDKLQVCVYVLDLRGGRGFGMLMRGAYSVISSHVTPHPRRCKRKLSGRQGSTRRTCTAMPWRSSVHP